MTRSTMSELVKRECRHIPRGDYAQNELRMTYAILRQHHLGTAKDASASAALDEAVASVMARHPQFSPLYDRSFFDGARANVSAPEFGDEHRVPGQGP